jgi:hypothetical protein
MVAMPHAARTTLPAATAAQDHRVPGEDTGDAPGNCELAEDREE